MSLKIRVLAHVYNSVPNSLLSEPMSNMSKAMDAMKILTSQYVTATRSRWDSRRNWLLTLPFIAFGLIIFASNSFAQTQEALPSASTLKKLSVEELMNIEVTSVSKRPEKLSE